MRQNDSQKWIIWSSSQPHCPGYPSSTSVPLGEAKWHRLLSEGPHQIAGLHPPTTLTWGSSLTLPLNNTYFHRSSHSCSSHSSLTWETINRGVFFAVLKGCRVTDPKKPIRSLLVRFSSRKCPTPVNVGIELQNYLTRWEWNLTGSVSSDFNYSAFKDISSINAKQAFIQLLYITQLLTLHTTANTLRSLMQGLWTGPRSSNS